MKRLIYLSGVFAFLILGSGCKKGWLSELGNNPNQPSNAPVQLLVAPVLTGFASMEVTLNTRVGVWMGYSSFAGGYSIDDNTLTYYVQQGNPSIWGYYDYLKNANYIEKTAGQANNMHYYVAVAKILQAYGFQKLVDAYGSVPYSEAFKGVGNFFPKYDDAQSIYNANIVQLDSAIALIEGANPANETSMAAYDIMFSGDMDKWAMFANTLKLRYLIRESDVIGDAAKAELAKTASVGFLDEDASVNPGYLNTAGKQSPLWASFATTPGGSLVSDGYAFLRAGGAALDFMRKNSDPRLFYVYSPVGGTSPALPNTFFQLDSTYDHYLGVYYGDRQVATTLGTNGVSGIGNGILNSYKQSVLLISAAQSNFLQAEAALKGWLPGGDAVAKTLYESGITASFETLGVYGDTTAKKYYEQPTDLISWDASPNKLEAIITQKWISLAYQSPIEAWSEYRRTGFPNPQVLPASKFPGYSRHMPTIFWYPKSESDTNADNYKAAGGPSTDPQNQKVFWDK